MMSDNNLNNLVSIDECKKILSQKIKTKFEIKSYTVTKLGGEVAGFLAEHYKLVIVADNVQHSFFLKCLPLFNDAKRNFLIKSEIFAKETEVYKILEAFDYNITGKKWKPKCYLSRHDLIVLEDLNEDGYTTMPDRFEYKEKHVRLVLKSLAALHASSLLYEEKNKTDVFIDFRQCLFEVSALRTNTWFVTGLKSLVAVALDTYKHDEKMLEMINEKFMNDLLKVCDDIQTQVMPRYIRVPMVLCHRDIWTKNLLFDSVEDPKNCVLIDFQIARYLPPGADVMMACTMLQHEEDRLKGFFGNVQFYYTTLREMLKGTTTGKVLQEYLPSKKLEQGCFFFRKMALVLKGIFLTMTHLPPGVMDAIHADKDVYHQFITVDRSPTVLKYVKEDECFRSWIVETVQELVELMERSSK